ncbi:MAG: hypothetical protein A3F72_03690 [Bacteroidetes bacterium RIFCSPLOWO2_12_FULL_35_15]|nr:MAG: hypothetical protein A3F72_03690 [Bacteroidetes bacterium RIFCSPLOWO2_12_FULL_35_15]
MNSFPHKLFDLQQPAVKLSPKVELAVLQELLANKLFTEDYEICITIQFRITELKIEMMNRSSSRKRQ